MSLWSTLQRPSGQPADLPLVTFHTVYERMARGCVAMVYRHNKCHAYILYNPHIYKHNNIHVYRHNNVRMSIDMVIENSELKSVIIFNPMTI